MKQNPLIVWSLERVKRDPRGLAALLGFVLFFYGMVGLTVLSWSSSLPRRMEDFLTILHYEAWGTNLLVLMLYAPARMAQGLARERERGTLDMLLLTGLSGRELALGQLGAAVILPLGMVLATAPVIFLGMFMDHGFEAVLRGYVGLFACLPVYALAAGIAGLSVKKAQSAGGAAILMLMGALASGLFLGPWRDLKPLAMLGPWGSGLATNRDELNQLFVLGETLPAELLQLPLLAAMTWALLIGLDRRIGGEPAALLGRRGALTLAGGVALIAVLSFSPQRSFNWQWSFNPGDPSDQVFARYLMLWLVLLLLALEVPVGWRDLVRGLTRRADDDAAFDHERLRPARFAAGPALLGVFTLLTVWGAGLDETIDVGSFLGCLFVGASSWVVAAVAFQAAHLLTRDQGMPRLFAILTLLAVWCGPLVASLILTEVGFGGPLAAIARMPNPVVGLYHAGYHVELGRGGAALDPLSLAVACTVVQLCLAAGGWRLVQLGQQRAEERARELVPLPADAYAAPGTLTQRCERGHLFTAAWQRCPHCDEQVAATPPPSSP